MRPATHSSSFSVLRTLSGLSSQVCSNNRWTARAKLSTEITRNAVPRMVTVVLVLTVGDRTSRTASAPSPVRW